MSVPLSGEQKAAVVLLSLSDHAKKALLAEMSDTEVMKVLTAIKTLGIVDADVVQSLNSSFHDNIKPNGGVVGEEVMADSIITHHLDSARLEALVKPQSDVWARLENLPNELLVKQFAGENAGLVAVVLSKLPQDKLLNLLPLFSHDKARDILVAFTQLRPLSRDALEQVSNALDVTILSRLEQMDNRTQLNKTVSLLERFEPHFAKDMLDSLKQEQPELAVSLQGQMLSIEKLMSYSQSQLFKLLQDVPHNTLALALLDEEPNVIEFYLHHLSQNASNMVQEEMDLLVSSDKSVISAAKNEILALARSQNDATSL